MEEVAAFDDVKRILREYFSVPEEEITLDARLVDLGLDSLDVVELTMEVEDLYNVQIPNDEYMPWERVQNVVNHIVLHKLKKG